MKKNSKNCQIFSESDLPQLGKLLADNWLNLLKTQPNGTIFSVWLVGDLGSGKTTLMRYIGKYLGINELINSPTYSILHEFNGKHCDLFHCDLYRLTSSLELEELQLFEEQENSKIIAMEWANNWANDLPPADFIIDLDIHQQNRSIKITSGKSCWQSSINSLQQQLQKFS